MGSFSGPTLSHPVLLLLVLLLAAYAANAASVRRVWWPDRVLLATKPQALAVHGIDGCSPQQVLLSLGSDPTHMHLSWKTAATNCPSEVIFQRLDDQTRQQLQQLQEQQSQPPLSLGMDNTDNSVGFSYLLSERDMCDNPAASNPFVWHLHRATLKGLVPSASYRYRIVGGQQHWYFQAAPAPSPDTAFTFLGFGDMGDAVHPEAKSPGAASTLLRLRQEAEASRDPAELMLHVGDLSYANGNPEIWDSFIEGLQPFAARLPYMIAVGNHEYGYTARRGSSAAVFTDPSGAPGPYHPSWGNFGPDSQGECGAVTARRFHMPNYKGRRDNAPFWYGFDYGSVHFTVISTEHALGPGSRQYDWLQQELEAVDRCVTPWLVVLLHRPMYVVYPHKSNREVGEHIRSQIESMLLQHKVDMTIAGHVHSYYRTCAVQDEECVEENGSLRTFPTAASTAATASTATPSTASSSSSHARSQAPSFAETPGRQGGSAAGKGPLAGSQPHGIVHLIIGSAGRKLSDVERNQEVWCAETVQKWGFGRFTVRGSRSLLAEYVSSETGEVLDSVELRATDGSRGANCGSKATATAAAR